MRLSVAALVVLFALALAAAPDAPAAPFLGGCRVFPPATAANRGTLADFNRDVSRAPVDPRSARYVAAIGLGSRLHPDFGSVFGIPYRVVPVTQRRIPIRFSAYGSESDRGPYPVPLDAPVEGGSDRHVLVLQSGACRLYELFDAHRAGGGWSAGSGAAFDLRTGARRRDGWTSADAAGLPILPGLVRYDEVRFGLISHALRFTAPRTRSAYLHPATHYASNDASPDLPPMGLRLRLKAGYPIARFPHDSRVVLVALKRYGMLLADNGSPWFLTGARDRRWTDRDLDALKSVPASAFEVVTSDESLHTR